MSEADPGYRNPDASQGFAEMLSSLDHFQNANYVRAARRALYRLLRPKPGMRLLDAGCGTGIDVAALAAKVRPGGRVVGLDLSRRFINVAIERHVEADAQLYIMGSMEHLPFADGSFDAVCSTRTVQYVEDPVRALRELARVTTSGGRVVVIEGGMSSLDLPDSELTRYVFGPRAGLGARLPNLMREAGLVRVTVRPGFGVTLGLPDPMVLEYAREMAATAAVDGLVSEDEADAGLKELEALASEGRWFSADCMFVVVGTVA